MSFYWEQGCLFGEIKVEFPRKVLEVDLNWVKKYISQFESSQWASGNDKRWPFNFSLKGLGWYGWPFNCALKGLGWYGWLCAFKGLGWHRGERFLEFESSC